MSLELTETLVTLEAPLLLLSISFEGTVWDRKEPGRRRAAAFVGVVDAGKADILT